MVEKVLRGAVGDGSPTARLLYGVDVREGLRMLGDASIHCIVTSPPYFGLRSYLSANDPNKTCEVGSEASLDDYIQHLVAVFDELRRVLRKDGTVWLNLGGSYAGGGRAGKNPEYWARHTSFGKTDPVVHAGGFGLPSKVPEGMKPKDMVGEPWRVAFALQAAGWYLRAACPWVRHSGMPESCTDRPSTSVEYVFLLAHPDSGGDYFYDIHGLRMPSRDGGSRQRRTTDWFFSSLDMIQEGQGTLVDAGGHPLAFVVNPTSYSGNHFAAFPVKLVEPCILLSTSAGGCCHQCGTQRVRVGAGWGLACSCGEVGEARPVVLDPFSGSATTGKAALDLGRDYVGIDLSVDYLALAEARIRGDAPPSAASATESGSVLDLFGGSP